MWFTTTGSTTSADVNDRTARNLMPPPKRLTRDQDGLLGVRTFEGFEAWLDGSLDTRCVHHLKHGLGEEFCSVKQNCLELQSEAGFQAFVFDEPVASFRFQAAFQLQGKGKCGMVFRIDPETHDGYYLSLDLLKGIVQLRSWKTGPPGSGENMMQFRTLQSGYWYAETPGQAHLKLIGFGSYLEFSVNDRVILSLADQSFDQGLLGVYLETTHLVLSDVQVHRMRPPHQSDEHLVSG